MDETLPAATTVPNKAYGQVRDDEAVDELGEAALFADVGKVREAALVLVAHVHAAVEHDVLAAQRHQHTAAADIWFNTPRHEPRLPPGQLSKRRREVARSCKKLQEGARSCKKLQEVAKEALPERPGLKAL